VKIYETGLKKSVKNGILNGLLKERTIYGKENGRKEGGF
jgi:hypothetical protein